MEVRLCWGRWSYAGLAVGVGAERAAGVAEVAMAQWWRGADVAVMGGHGGGVLSTSVIAAGCVEPLVFGAESNKMTILTP